MLWKVFRGFKVSEKNIAPCWISLITLAVWADVPLVTKLL